MTDYNGLDIIWR